MTPSVVAVDAGTLVFIRRNYSQSFSHCRVSAYIYEKNNTGLRRVGNRVVLGKTEATRLYAEHAKRSARFTLAVRPRAHADARSINTGTRTIDRVLYSARVSPRRDARNKLSRRRGSAVSAE